jgi:hypothetical protein
MRFRDCPAFDCLLTCEDSSSLEGCPCHEAIYHSLFIEGVEHSSGSWSQA